MSRMSLPVKFYKYSKVVKNQSDYGKRMARLSNRIFGEVYRNLPVQNLKVIKLLTREPMNKDDDLTNHYPAHPQYYELFRTLRNLGLYRDEHMDFGEEMERLRTIRGKGREPREEVMKRLAANKGKKED